MHALSVKQPWCEQIASGKKRDEFRTWAPRVLVGRDLLIVASRTLGPGYRGEPTGVAICVVTVERIRETDDGYAWRLANPRRVEPELVKGSAALFTVDDARIRYAPRAAGAIVVASPPSVGRRSRAPRAATPPETTTDPYVLRVGKREIATARNPIKARTVATALAAKRGESVTVDRDGFELYTVAPPGQALDLSPDDGEPYTFAIAGEPIPGSEASEAEARDTARFLSSFHHGKRVTILLDGKPLA